MSDRGQDNSNNNDIFLISAKMPLMRAPINRKYLRSNQSSFMNKDISKAIMNRST